MRNNIGTCRDCGREIRWIRTVAGKNMPCDPKPQLYIEDLDGGQRFVTRSGEVVSGTATDDQERATGIGFTPHWATCRSGKEFGVPK